MNALYIDYAGARPAPTAIRDSGYTGVFRYLSLDAGKNLQPAERDALLAAGLSIGLVWETTATRAAAGYSAGATDAKIAEAQAKTLGQPAGLPIFYAVDFDADPAAVKAYFDGVRSVATRPVGIYGSLRVVDAALSGGWAVYGWQSCAWSGGKVSQRAHLYQRLRPTVTHPIAGTDENIVLQPFPMWTKAAPAPNLPTSAASDVPPVFTKPTPAPAKPAPAPSKGLTVQTIDLRNADRVTVKGPGVKPLQRLLGVTADGLGGRNTKAALHAFQLRVFGVKGADDIFGQQTAEALLAGK